MLGGVGGPTLAVWPKVALAALGCVDDHGAVPAAAVPPQPVGLVRAPVDPFLAVARASAGGLGKDRKMSAMGRFGFFFPL